MPRQQVWQQSLPSPERPGGCPGCISFSEQPPMRRSSFKHLQRELLPHEQPEPVPSHPQLPTAGKHPRPGCPGPALSSPFCLQVWNNTRLWRGFSSEEFKSFPPVLTENP